MGGISPTIRLATKEVIDLLESEPAADIILLCRNDLQSGHCEHFDLARHKLREVIPIVEDLRLPRQQSCLAMTTLDLSPYRNDDDDGFHKAMSSFTSQKCPVSLFLRVGELRNEKRTG